MELWVYDQDYVGYNEAYDPHVQRSLLHFEFLTFYCTPQKKISPDPLQHTGILSYHYQ